MDLDLKSSRTQFNLIRKSKGHTLVNKLHQLVGQGSFEEILVEALDKIGQLLNTNRVGIMLYNEETSELVLQKPAFGNLDEELIRKYRIPLERGGNAVSVFLTGVPTLTNNAFKEPHYIHEIIKLFGNDKAIITVPLSVHTKRIGILHAGRSEGVFTEDDLDLLMDISYHLGMIIDGALQMKQSSSTLFNRKEVESYLRGRLVRGVFNGDAEDLDYWLKNGQKLRLPIHSPFIVIGMKFSSSNVPTITWPENKADSIEQMIRRTLPIFGLHYDRNLISIVITDEKYRDWATAAIRLKEDLTQFMKKQSANGPFEIIIGFGRPVENLLQITESYKRAALVLKYASFYPNKIAFYSETAAWSLLAEVFLNQPEVAKEFVDRHLEPLKALKSDLKNTLECYLLNERHMKRTADALFIHPNTLKFRIEKIEKEINLDLSHYETRLNLIAALRLEKLF